MIMEIQMNEEERKAYEDGRLGNSQPGYSYLEEQANLRGKADRDAEQSRTQASINNNPLNNPNEIGDQAAGIVLWYLNFMGIKKWQGRFAGGFLALEVFSQIALTTLVFKLFDKFPILGAWWFALIFFSLATAALLYVHRFKIVRYPLTIIAPIYLLVLGTLLVNGGHFRLDNIPIAYVIFALVSLGLRITFLFGFSKE